MVNAPPTAACLPPLSEGKGRHSSRRGASEEIEISCAPREAEGQQTTPPSSPERSERTLDADEGGFIQSSAFKGARSGYTFKSGPHGTGYYLDREGSTHLDAPASSARPWEGTPQEKPARDGVPLTEELIRRKAEHNEGMLSTLEEIALHQLDIDKIETLNNCRCLKIVYLQSNLIRKLEGLHRLKQLDYLNVALNNISRIENLQGCESLRKLDLTVNFIDLDELHSVGTLKNNIMLRELFLTGNPCQQHWEAGYRDYVIATLPQLELLDGVAVTKSERIKAVQRCACISPPAAPLTRYSCRLLKIHTTRTLCPQTSTSLLLCFEHSAT